MDLALDQRMEYKSEATDMGCLFSSINDGKARRQGVVYQPTWGFSSSAIPRCLLLIMAKLTPKKKGVVHKLFANGCTMALPDN